VLRGLVEDLHPDAERVVLVLDNLNTHKPAALYEAFEPERARRIDSAEERRREVAAWEDEPNERQGGVSWQFTTADARIKRRQLYTVIQTDALAGNGAIGFSPLRLLDHFLVEPSP
jgi:hypothetical protein